MSHYAPLEVWATLTWVVLIWSSSAAGFLLTRPLFASWPDQGYALSRLAGPLLVGALSWEISAAGGWPLNVPGALVALALLALAAGVTWWLIPQPLPPARTLIRIDVMTALAFVAFAVVRSWSPSISGTERPMDHALLAAMIAQQTAVPVDPWLSGHVVNYHVAGYAWWAPLAILVQQPPWVSYNLVMATLPAQLLAGAWSIGQRLHARWAWLAATALVVAGPWTALVLMIREGRLPMGVEPTRVLPDTINEFPFFSLIWGDLHGHVLAMPLLVLLVGVLVRLEEATREPAMRARVVPLVALAAAVGTACVLTSSWDLAPVVIAGGWVVAMVLTRTPSLAPTAGAAGLVVALVLAWPTLQTFRPPAVAFGWEWHASPLGPFVLVLGTWLLPVALVAVAGRWTITWTAACAAAATIMALAPGFRVRALLALLAFGIWRRRAALGTTATALLLSAFALLLLAESIWVDDIYGWDLRRLNTVFKSHLHAIVLLSLALPAMTHLLWREPRRRVRVTLRAALIVLVASAVTASAGVLAARWRDREPTRSLNGLAAMQRHWPGDAAAVRYLWQQAAPDDVVLEASGTSYSYASRISFMTGQPTLLGWEGHERLWRRGADWDATIDRREADVEALYGGPVDGLAARLASSGVRYIVVGAVERRRYPHLTPERFADVADEVLDEQGTVLLRVR